METAEVWVEVFDFEAAGTPRTPPLPSLKKEVLESTHDQPYLKLTSWKFFFQSKVSLDEFDGHIQSSSP